MYNTLPDYTFHGRLTRQPALLGDIWCIGDFEDKNELWASMQVVDPDPQNTYATRENADLLGSHTSPPPPSKLKYSLLVTPPPPLDDGHWMTFKFRNRRSDEDVDDRTLGPAMVLKVPWGECEEDEYPLVMEADERLVFIFDMFSCDPKSTVQL